MSATDVVVEVVVVVGVGVRRVKKQKKEKRILPLARRAVVIIAQTAS